MSNATYLWHAHSFCVLNWLQFENTNWQKFSVTLCCIVVRNGHYFVSKYSQCDVMRTFIYHTLVGHTAYTAMWWANSSLNVQIVVMFDQSQCFCSQNSKYFFFAVGVESNHSADCQSSADATTILFSLVDRCKTEVILNWVAALAFK